MFTTSQLTGKIITVNGLIGPAEVGVTMAHEHLLLLFGPPPTAALSPCSTSSPCVLGDVTTETTHVKAYLSPASGSSGKTLISMSTYGLRWDTPGAPPPPSPSFVGALQDLANDSGAQIILGTGFYKEYWQTTATLALSISELAAIIVNDVFTGQSGVSAGIIGEVGITDPSPDVTISYFEWMSLIAACAAQAVTGLAINIHTDIGTPWPVRQLILTTLQQYGVPLGRVVFSHLDPSLADEVTEAQTLMAAGALCCFDLIGHGDNDSAMAAGIFKLIGDGYLGQILLSQDIYCAQLFFNASPAVGYDYLSTTFEPLLTDAGVTAAQITQMRATNPQTVLPVAFQVIPPVTTSLTTLSGITTNGTVNSVTGLGGGTALQFAGGYLSAPNAAAVQPLIPFTVAVWFQSSAAPTSWVCLADDSLTPPSGTTWPAQAAQGWQLDAVPVIGTADGGLQFSVGNGDGNIVTALGGGNIFDGNWHFLAGVFDGSTVYVYVDGVLSDGTPWYTGSALDTGCPVAPSGGIAIGQTMGGTNTFTGLLQSLVFINRAVDASWILTTATGTGTITEGIPDADI